MTRPFRVGHSDDTHGGGEAPAQAHLALQTGAIGDPAGILPIPPGAHMFIIADPRKADTIHELILQKVHFKDSIPTHIDWVVFTRSAKSTRRMRMTITWEGQYASPLDEQAGKVNNKLGGK